MAAATACLRTSDLAITGNGETGIPGMIRRMIYQGGHFRAEFQPDAASDLKFVLEVPEPTSIGVGSRISVAVRDGWVIPPGSAR